MPVSLGFINWQKVNPGIIHVLSHRGYVGKNISSHFLLFRELINNSSDTKQKSNYAFFSPLDVPQPWDNMPLRWLSFWELSYTQDFSE